MGEIMEMQKSTALPSAWIDKLFQRLAGMYGAKWLDLWRGTDLASVKAIWAEDLAGYSGEEIKRGLNSCKSRTFPPTLPEFLTLCRPPLNPENAFHEAITQLAKRKEGHDKWSHKAIYWAAQAIGSSDMLNSNWSGIGKRWMAVLNEMLAEQNLPEIPAFAVELPPPGKTSVDPEEAKSRIAAVVKSVSAPTDYKAWAKKLVVMEAEGRGKPHPTALRMAHEELAAAA